MEREMNMVFTIVAELRSARSARARRLALEELEAAALYTEHPRLRAFVLRVFSAHGWCMDGAHG